MSFNTTNQMLRGNLVRCEGTKSFPLINEAVYISSGQEKNKALTERHKTNALTTVLLMVNYVWCAVKI